MITQTHRPSIISTALPSFQQFLLAVLFGGLLSISFLDSNQYYLLTWFAFIPLLFSVEGAGLIRTYVIGLIAGLACYVSGMYWIVDFIIISKGYTLSSSLLLASLYWFYCAHLIALLLLFFGWLKRHTGIHEFLLFPLTVATFTSSFPMLFSMRLGESQINFHSALQAIEITGVHGLDFIIALFNIVVFRFLYQRHSDNVGGDTRAKWPWAVAISLMAAWFIYGVIQYSLWESKIEKWSTFKVGIVQPNEIPTLGKKTTYPGYSSAYPPEMEMTSRLSHLGAEIIIWPEAQAKGYLDNSNIRAAYQKNIKNLGSSVVFQDMQHHRDPINGELKTQTNTAIMLDDSGRELGQYVKMKRIPFGEYVPYTGDNSLIKRWIDGIFGDFLIETSKGEKHQLFTHDKVNIIPLICYETTSPRFVASAVNNTLAQANKYNGSLLVALSNDGWFGSTHQPNQHIMPSVLRAVENRLPLVHVANNGPSIVVTPSGEVVFKSDFQTAAGYVTDVPYSNAAQGSFYSKYPKLFDYILYWTVIFLTLLSIYSVIINKRQR